MVTTAQTRNIEISSPPMEVVEKYASTIRYILYLDNIDVIHTMCDSPFEMLQQ